MSEHYSNLNYRPNGIFSCSNHLSYSIQKKIKNLKKKLKKSKKIQKKEEKNKNRKKIKKEKKNLQKKKYKKKKWTPSKVYKEKKLKNKKYKKVEIRNSWKTYLTLWILMCSLLEVKRVDLEGGGMKILLDNTITKNSLLVFDTPGTHPPTGIDIHWDLKVVWLSNKLINKKMKIVNGNRSSNTNIKILHWNGGAKLFENKLLEVESLIREWKPDMFYLSEANLWEGLDPDEMEIPGYKLILPNTMGNLKHARLIVMVKEDLIIEEIVEKNTEAAMIWVRVGPTRRNSIIVGGGV